MTTLPCSQLCFVFDTGVSSRLLKFLNNNVTFNTATVLVRQFDVCQTYVIVT